MKSSNPNISGPLSRSKKRGSIFPMVLIGAIFFGVVVFGFFYFTVYQAMGHDNRRHEMHNADGVPRAMVDGFERHHPHHHDKLVDTFHGKLILSTEMGDIIIKLHPDMSPESAAYVHDIAKNGCDRCAFYRAEKPGIFQGMITSSLPSPVVKGACPEDEQGAAQVCPEHDPHCACHGPVMTKGMVAWAGGGTGPDFFINMYEHPASHWGNQHT